MPKLILATFINILALLLLYIAQIFNYVASVFFGASLELYKVNNKLISSFRV